MAERKNIPEIRFAGFDDPWEQRILGDVRDIASASRVHKHQWTEAGVPFYRSSDVVSAFKGIENTKAYISYNLYNDLSKKSGRIVANDILITGGGSIGIPFLVENNEPLYFKDADLLWLKNSNILNSRFLYVFFTTNIFRKYLDGISHTGTISHYTIEQAKSTTIQVPSTTEQSKIGSLFQTLDTLITLRQRKYDKLLTIKKALLEKMFPRDGASLPELRFAGFDEPWEQRTLGEISLEYNGGGTPKTDTANYWNGSIPWIQSSDLTENKLCGIVPRKSITEEGLKNSATKLIPENSIAIVTRVGVGKLALMPYKYATSQDFLSISKLKIDKWYGAYSIWNMLQKELLLVQGTSIKGLTKDDLLSKKLFVPCQNEEQTKIGNLFQTLDTLITLQKQELDKLKQLKKALLEKMFV